MSKIGEFIDSLSDYELAVFSKYKQHTYLKGTQQEIKGYLIGRGLDQAKINRLVKEIPVVPLTNDEKRCPRCYSDKVRADRVEWTTSGEREFMHEALYKNDFVSETEYIDKLVCNVCGYKLNDPNHDRKNVFQRLWELMKQGRRR